MNSWPCRPVVADRHYFSSPTWLRLDSSLFRPTRLSLAKEDVHVWLSFTEEMLPRFRSFLATLAADEIEKARRFHFQKDRDRYVLARGVLREILSIYAGIHPSELRFCYGAHGKPAFTSEGGDERLSFNLSHANGVVVYVVTHDREIGVDLEYLSEGIDVREVAGRCFSRREVSLLEQLPTGLRQEAFLTCWTRKEAYVKARGEGLSIDLQSFEVLTHGDLVPRLHIESDPRAAAQWSLMDLDAPAGYVGALAVEGNAHRVRYWRWKS